MTPVFAALVSRIFGVPEDLPTYPLLRYLFWTNTIIITMITCLFVMEIYVHALKYGWIKEIYTLLNVIKVREKLTQETHEKVDKTVEKLDHKVQSLIESKDGNVSHSDEVKIDGKESK